MEDTSTQTPSFIRKVINWPLQHWKLSLILIVIIGLALGWYLRSRGQADEVETTSAEYRDLTQTLEVSGEIDASEKVDLHFQTIGKLTWIDIAEGDWVDQWQVIATQDSRSVEKQLQKDLNTFNQEFRDHDQVLDDNDYYGGSGVTDEVRRILENAQFDLENSVIDVEIRELSKELSRLVAPISGVVTDISTPIAGVNITPADTFRIVNPKTLYFSAEIDETDIAVVREGQTATITLDAYPDDEIASTITWIDFAVSTSDGGGTVFLVKLSLPDANLSTYRLGLNGEASIILAQKSHVLSIPIEALNEDDEGEFVTVIENGQTKRVAVSTGLETDDYIEITDGLSQNDTIVIPD